MLCSSTGAAVGDTLLKAKHPFLEKKMHLAFVFHILNNLQPEHLLIAYSSDPDLQGGEGECDCMPVFFFLEAYCNIGLIAKEQIPLCLSSGTVSFLRRALVTFELTCRQLAIKSVTKDVCL